MNTSAIGIYTVTIAGQQYTKEVSPIRDFLSTDYFVNRVQADGTVVQAYLNKNAHRSAIRRIESALAAKK